jgi:hypothetical protein
MHFIVSPPVNERFVRANFGDYKSPLIPVRISRKCNHLTRERRRNFCLQDVGVEISILVIITDSSETVSSRDGQVVSEGCYQLFINSIINSSSGQLKEHQICVNKCIIFFTVIIFGNFVKAETLELFLI